MTSENGKPVDGILKQDDGAPVGGMDGREVSDTKKKPRLQWDENNLTTNEKEKVKNPKMKIDEPKTPFHNGALSDAGSSTSGSVPQSPDAGPSVTFVEDSRLTGFEQLEMQYKTGAESESRASSGPVAGLGDSNSLGGSGSASAGESSTPRSKQFAQKRKMHYHAEFHRLDRSMDEISDSDGDEVERASRREELEEEGECELHKSDAADGMETDKVSKGNE